MKNKLYLTFAILLAYQFGWSQEHHSFQLSIEIPKQNVTEYHAPYVATWIETEDRKTIIATSLWYDEQEKWLKDIRQWWRKTGRTQKSPYDGVTGASRRPGTHRLVLNSNEISKVLMSGNYVLLIEAAREVGGREVLKLPFSWPLNKEYTYTTKGDKELAKVTLTIKYTEK